MEHQYHVSATDGGWQVRRDNARRALSIHATQKDALDEARRLVKQSGGKLVMHGRDGRVASHFGRDADPSREEGVGAYEAKTHFSELLERVENGEEILITRHGSPVARLVPARKRSTRDERRAAIDRIHHLRERLTLGGLKIRDLINEGRR